MPPAARQSAGNLTDFRKQYRAPWFSWHQPMSVLRCALILMLGGVLGLTVQSGGDSVAIVNADETQAKSLVPTGWDAALAGDEVLQGLVVVTDPRVKGAHDAEMVLVGDRAYIVAEVNDDRAGESAGWPEIYVALSIVNLQSLKTEAVIPFARSEERFENETLPVGACFVPRIIQKDARTLRCYFASEQPGKRQAQTWYRDFDWESRKFAPEIHKARLKTASGVHPMQPRYLHADAVNQGFQKPAKDYGLYLFDSFKEFDGQTYVALNNFPGKQNALAKVHDDLATFEVLGHYNEPQSVNLSESAVNRLPDGTWLAICRQDGGNSNYYFTTSQDGKEWTTAREWPSVPNGTNSKPTFDKFGDTYYLGWQEQTRIHGAHRSVFNIDISHDGQHWERKYRFETPHSFQYPTFREHQGTVWLCVTQGDSSPSRKERIMFGRLEETEAFASQAGKVRTPIPPPPEPPALMKPGVKLFTDRDYVLTEVPESLQGQPFLRTGIEGYEIVCKRPGPVYALTLSQEHPSNRKEELQKLGFESAGIEEFQLFRGDLNRVQVLRKDLKTGERLRFRKLVFLVLGEGTHVEVTKPRDETPAEAAGRIARLESIAAHALETPVLNTSPLPEFDYDRLDYGMTIGIERTPGGRLWACWVAGGDSPDAFFVLATSDDEGETWSRPRLVVNSQDPALPVRRSVLVGNLWTDPLGRLWLIFDQSMEMFDGRGGVWLTRCDNPDDEAPEWTTPRRIWHGVTLNKPTVLSTGEWLLPISLDQRGGLHAFAGCFAELDPWRGANVFVSTDAGETWTRRGTAQFPNPDWHEHMIVERRDGSLWMLARTRKGIMESTSTDGGRTWSEPVASAIQHPVARFHIRRLASGKLLLIKHGAQIDAHEGRSQLTAWLSDDDGQSWSGGLMLDERKGISYPDGFQAPDGRLFISYDRNRAEEGEILLARFTEADIQAGKLVTPGSRLKMLISRPLAPR